MLFRNSDLSFTEPERADRRIDPKVCSLRKEVLLRVSGHRREVLQHNSIHRMKDRPSAGGLGRVHRCLPES
jgi:hypothetical protein